MHIPDGYLSPATCAVATVAALPVWAVALRRVKRQLQSRLVPLLAVVSAFCFVVMMFNLPIPGGTTAHAVGMGLAAILLGPWAASLAISIALLIQALFFGDGGITTFGANCLNMAIVGSFVAAGVYRLLAGRAPLLARRRVVAAAVAGYAGINMAAFLAACEFGLQPLLFHDAAGTPLYAPYPFSVALPAMMLAHLTLAGAAEAVIAGGVVAYLQRANPALLEAPLLGGAPRRVSLRALWIGVGGMMVCSPLGLLAAGMAWGEWRVEDLQNPQMRQQIAAVSGHLAPPPHPPAGLERLAGLWHAPLPDYAPAFLHNATVGYAASAVMGGGLVILLTAALTALLAARKSA
ncbi:fused nickel transport protein NikMN [mine drainage metagenome]|uniref:Fused nickel transport protein NikMN n=1 Tax=mine drainage metagenome TaxID=410659 RepID=A0A1J5SX53_9ZZZZ